jgi:sulfopyruvate decarboxylase TPP-binding subunit
LKFAVKERLDIDVSFPYTQFNGATMELELAEKIVGALKEAGISFVAYLPETRLSQIMPVLREDGSFMVVPVANESEGVSIATGASLGGRPAAVYMEGSGVYVSS